jgi:hypothetical protein
VVAVEAAVGVRLVVPVEAVEADPVDREVLVAPALRVLQTPVAVAVAAPQDVQPVVQVELESRFCAMQTFRQFLLNRRAARSVRERPPLSL